MEVSGSARVIAAQLAAQLGRGHATMAVVLACAVLTYGGVSLVSGYAAFLYFSLRPV